MTAPVPYYCDDEDCDVRHVGEQCPAEHRGVWDDRPVELHCERHEGHPGPHSAGTGEWEW